MNTVEPKKQQIPSAKAIREDELDTGIKYFMLWEQNYYKTYILGVYQYEQNEIGQNQKQEW